MEESHSLAVSLFSEILMADQLARSRLGKALPKGMELSHFSVLNHLTRTGVERSPAQLAKAFHVTRGAMTNTLNKLEVAGYIHIRPDWDDARKKQVSISDSGRSACDRALTLLTPEFQKIAKSLGDQSIKAVLRTLRKFRTTLRA